MSGGLRGHHPRRLGVVRHSVSNDLQGKTPFCSFSVTQQAYKKRQLGRLERHIPPSMPMWTVESYNLYFSASMVKRSQRCNPICAASSTDHDNALRRFTSGCSKHLGPIRMETSIFILRVDYSLNLHSQCLKQLLLKNHRSIRRTSA